MERRPAYHAKRATAAVKLDTCEVTTYQGLLDACLRMGTVHNVLIHLSKFDNLHDLWVTLRALALVEATATATIQIEWPETTVTVSRETLLHLHTGCRFVTNLAEKQGPDVDVLQ